MDETKKLLPENDMQELWELHSRVYAVIEYVKTEMCIDKRIILAVLGAKEEL